MADAQLVWKPHAGQQERFLSSPAFEALFGGAAGPGKTDCLLMEALRQIHIPRYRAILFRRTFPRLSSADGLIDRSKTWYPGYHGIYHSQDHYWRFPSGARIYFGHMQYTDDKNQFQSAQYQYIGFDELTEFEESQYLYLFSRCRTTKNSGLRCYVRGATNPGGIGHNWVKKRFIAQGITNQIGYFAMVDDQDTRVDKDYPTARSRAFYPAFHNDNPALDMDYISNLSALQDKVDKARLLYGDWDAEHIEGRVYENWSSTDNVSTDAEYHEDKGDVYWAVDDGYAYGRGPGDVSYHPRIVLMFQITSIGGIDVFYEYCEAGATYGRTMEVLKSLPYPSPRLCYVDSSAAVLRAELSSQGWPNAGMTHPVGEGIKNVRRFIQDSSGARLLRVHPRCANLIFEMTEYRHDSQRAKVGELVPLKVSDHSQDALRYGLWDKRHSR